MRAVPHNPLAPHPPPQPILFLINTQRLVFTRRIPHSGKTITIKTSVAPLVYCPIWDDNRSNDFSRSTNII